MIILCQKGHTSNRDWTICLKIKIHSISRINSPKNMLPSLVLSSALALELRHGHGPTGHGGPLLFFCFFQRACPRSPSRTMSYVDLQWPVLHMRFTCNGRLPSVKVYLVLSLGCSNEHHVATASATVAVAKARQPCILYSIHITFLC